MPDSQSFNPYAAPQVVEAPLARLIDTGDLPEVWADGKLLVVPRGAALPARCIKCDAREVRLPKKLKLTWQSPWVLLGLLGGLLPIIILALIFQKKMTVEACMCEAHWQRRKSALLWGWSGLLAAIVLLIIALSATPTAVSSTVRGVLIASSIFWGIAALINMSFRSRLLTPHRINKEFGWFTGCGPEFLASLPAPPMGYQRP